VASKVHFGHVTFYVVFLLPRCSRRRKLLDVNKVGEKFYARKKVLPSSWTRPRTACWQGLRDKKKCKCVKFKIADGRRFENL